MVDTPYRRRHENRAGGLRITQQSTLCSILFILINILFILIIPSCPRVLVSQHKQQSTIIWLGITRLGSARPLGGEMLF
jgi:hypothetical protein